MGNKKYILGNHELEAYELRLLKRCLLTVIEEDRAFLDKCDYYNYSNLIKDYYDHETDILIVILKDVEAYFNGIE